MNMRNSVWTIAVLGILGLALAGRAYSDGNTQAAGIHTTNGDASPAGGSNQPGGISNIDDYTYQNDQLNINASEDNVVKVLRVNQKNLINDYVVRVFPIQNAPPIELKNVFKLIVGAEGGTVEVIRDQVQKQNFLYVAAPKFQIPYVEAALRELDVPWLKDQLDGSKKGYYKAKFRSIANIDPLAQIPAGAGDGTSVLDLVNNASMRIGEPYRVANYTRYAAQVDQPIPQVLLEASVYEIEVSDELRIGLDYIAWKNGPGRNLFDFTFWGLDYRQDAENLTSVLDPFIPGRTAVAGSARFDGNGHGWYMATNYVLAAGYFDFLRGVGRARLVTQGKALIKNSQTGTIAATDQVIYIHTNPDETNTPVDGITPAQPVAGIPVYNRTLTDDGRLTIGFAMSISPMIAAHTTELGITLALNDIVGQTPSGTPQVRTNSLATTVLVRDGQEICIGGLRRTEDVKNTAKAPILGSIPLLGYLFGHEASAKRETELVVVLTPTIIFGSEADQELASEKDKLIRAKVEKQVALTLPATEVGFDQWLLSGGDTVNARTAGETPAGAPATEKK